jgi:16S rRNA (cytosine967-C5)-methyltransferase
MNLPAGSIDSARAAAAIVICQLLDQGASLGRSLAPASERVPPRDRGLVKELAFGTARMLPRLRGLVDQLLKKPLRRKDRDVYALLLVGCYQLSYTRIPDHAAISETVAAAVALRKHWAKALVNGVLRQYQRRHTALEQNLSPAQALAHPEWLLQALQRDWPEHWQQIVAANNQPPPMTLRVNEARTGRDDYLAALAQQGIAATAGRWSPSAVYLASGRDVGQLPGFADGLVSVQDEAAQLSAPLLLQDEPGHLLDACCAPGGKTGHILELAGNASVDALELDGERMARVVENLTRLQLRARPLIGDAARPAAWWDGRPYDAILLDAPCSASGVIRRNPDIKSLRQAGDVGRLQRTQRELLTGLWSCLRPGGLLVYVTCSIFNAENQEVVGAFVADTPDCRHQPIAADWGVAMDHGRQILPTSDNTDGFYHACLRKIS